MLVVDDHQVSRMVTEAALRQNGLTVKQATSAAEALRLALAWLPQVILMDVELPDTDGFQAVRRIRRAWPRRHPLPRIVMTSAAPPDQARGRVPSTETDGYLLKPVDRRSLLDAVQPPESRATPSDGPVPEAADLWPSFRAELERRTRELDRCMMTCDLAAARSILHQLIASSGMFGEAGLERSLRALHSTCCELADSARLAQDYFRVLVEVQACLDSGPHRDNWKSS